MNTVTRNTLNDIQKALVARKRTLKAIATECRYFEEQVSDDYAKSLFARLSDCKTREQFNAVFASIEI